ncbi:release factor glutamine methyltransferase [Kineothrix alysoides]|uniref:Release factor glutamine methyltransferase n=1 Tax=Kineothrix alysoides TaxID=1469948 RepID=A0A4R1QPY9_9FIRM|nr:peptide chain release factor N(5)-glutamine methyltransferase [Kineothrix alysoides]TCL55886.1 release factor glutamine methyltransferase [Kineothrix alysoides]
MKYKELYDFGALALMEAGIAEASLDARLLLEFICHTNRNDLLVHGDKEVLKEEQDIYVNYIERRKAHEPLQHITGEQEFMGLVFEVNENVLVPRQDTEVLVEEAMRCLHDGMSVLDMCTGSGCILLSLLKYSNGCKGVGADISPEAVATAKRNAQKSQIAEVSFVESDLFESVEGRYDIIVSNPPYISTGEISDLMEEVKVYEPVLALDGGEDGLFFYRKIIEEAPEYLNGGGYLFFEIGYDQAGAVTDEMKKAGYKEVTAVKDYAGLDRVVYGYMS